MKHADRHFSEAPSTQGSTASTSSDAVRNLVQELMGKARELQSSVDDLARGGAEVEQSTPVRAETIRKILKMRARRSEHFPAGLFADPAWDMLLNLYASHLEQRREAIGGLVSMAGVPPTTGLRWVHKLKDDNFIAVHDDPLDHRRKFVELTQPALEAMENYFRANRPLAA